uniref:Ovule protein n=1 Tax=Brugia timori TaxID=42155 RepID=A0A0R3RA79_9BILA
LSFSTMRSLSLSLIKHSLGSHSVEFSAVFVLDKGTSNFSENSGNISTNSSLLSLDDDDHVS